MFRFRRRQYSGSGRFQMRPNFRSRRRLQLGFEIVLRRGVFFGRDNAHFQQKIIQLALRGIAIGLAVHQLFEYFLGAIELAVGDQSVTELRQRIRQAERITGAAVTIHQPFVRFDAARQTCRELVQEAADGFVLAGVEHGDARALDDGHGLFALARLQHGFRNFLRQAKIFLVGFENAQRQGGSFIPIAALYVQFQKQLGLFPTLFQVGRVLEKLGGLRGITTSRERASLDDRSCQIVGIQLQGFVG